MAEKIKLLFATQTGNSEDLANRTQEKLEELDFEVDSVNVADLDLDDLTDANKIIFIGSTWGDGEPPDDAIDFFDNLEGAELDLSGATYAILGLGDTSYDDFCGFAKRVGEHLSRMGATEIMERKDLDVDFDAGFEAWLEELCGKLS